MLMQGLYDPNCGLFMAQTAQEYSGEQGITREHMDEYALRSQKCADDAYKAGRIQEELVPVELKDRKGQPSGKFFTEDDHRRADTTLEGLAKLPAAFGKGGTVTAGNASGIVDGGAAVVIMSMQDAANRKLKPMGRIVSWGIAGVPPRIMGQGPVPATRVALKKAGLTL